MSMTCEAERVLRIKRFFEISNPWWGSVASNPPQYGREIAHVRCPSGVDQIAISNLREEIRILEKQRTGSPPLFVSYFTKNSPYELLAEKLSESLNRHGMPHRIVPMRSQGSWVANTGLKAKLIKKFWHDSADPICWIDADAEIIRPPYYVFNSPFDLAVVRRNGWYDMSGFVYVGKTQAAYTFLTMWEELCKQYPNVWDQALLTIAWYQTVKVTPFASMWINDGTFRFSRSRLRDWRDRLFFYSTRLKVRPFVSQKQASRTLKKVIDSGYYGRELSSDDISPDFRLALIRHEFDFDAQLCRVFLRQAVVKPSSSSHSTAGVQ